jgi:hypothetical protein
MIGMSNREGLYDRAEASPSAFLEIWIQKGATLVQDWFSDNHHVTRRVMVSTILILALLAFELFNFDTTEYALEDLLGPTNFAGIRWATILAIAFCGIDFAGLARLIMPDEGAAGAPSDTRIIKPTWLLLGAWLLGGGVNATMTWWAVSLVLVDYNLGNELISRQQLLRGVPIFVSMLVWMTRILIISSFSATGDRVGLQLNRRTMVSRSGRHLHATRPLQRAPLSAAGRRSAEPEYVGAKSVGGQRTSVSSHRPRMPRRPRGTRPATVPMQMKGRDQ